MVSSKAIHSSDSDDALSPPRRFSDKITAVLLDRIQVGIYPPGTKLPPTRQLSEDFNVSQPIVREALSRLKHDGYIEPRQGSGIFVHSDTAINSLRLSMDDPAIRNMLADTFEMRLYLEQSCAELAALRRSDSDLEKLKTQLDAMGRSLTGRENGTDADVKFHVAIAQATKNHAMWQLASYLHETMSKAVSAARTNSGRTPGRPEQAQQEHEAIYQAIYEQDAFAAGRAMRLHLESAAARLGLQFSGMKSA